MTEQTPPPTDPTQSEEADAAWKAEEAEEEAERAPDESTLLGRIGVEDEVLLELARAEAEMADPSLADESDDRGARV